MIGFYFVTAHCYGCGRPFSFNPELVPSIRIEGVRRPVCASYVERVNPMRDENGLEPISPLAGTYEAAPEFPDEEDF